MNNQTNHQSDSQSTRLVLLVVGILLIAANLRAAITGVGPLVGEIRDETGLTHTVTGMLTTLPLLAFAVLSPLTPRISNRLGTEVTLWISLILLAAGILLRSVPSIVALFAGTLLLGLAIAVGNVLLPSLIKLKFPQRIGMMTGLYTVSMTGCAAIASGVSVPLATGAGLGWRGALMSWAILAFIAILVWLPQIRAKQQGSLTNEPNSHLWRSSLAWQVTLFMGLQSFLFYSTITWLAEIITDRGISVSSAGWLLSLMQFASLPSTFLVPVLAGKRPNQRGIVIAAVITYLIGYLGLLYGGSTLLPLWVILIGLCQGACISLALTFIAMRASHARQAAELSGMAQSIGYLLAAVGPILFGYLHDFTSGWTVSLLLLIGVNILLFFVGIGAGRNAHV